MDIDPAGSEPEDTLIEPFSDNLESHHAAVFRYLYRMTGNWEEAQDLTQEAFTRWASHQSPMEGRDADRRWLFVVARNLALSQLRRQARTREHAANYRATGILHDPSPMDLESANETAEIVARAISELPLDMREIVILREYESMTYDEIANIVGTAIGTVKSRLARARAILRKKLSVILEAEK